MFQKPKEVVTRFKTVSHRHRSQHLIKSFSRLFAVWFVLFKDNDCVRFALITVAR